MTALRNRRCEPCPAGTPPLDPARAAALLAELAPGWRIAEDGRSPVPGRLMPMFACLLSPGPFTTQPMTATVICSTPGWRRRQSGMRSRRCDWIFCASSWK